MYLILIDIYVQSSHRYAVNFPLNYLLMIDTQSGVIYKYDNQRG